MKKSIVIPTLIASFAMIAGVISFSPNNVNETPTKEIFNAEDPNTNWGGMKAMPFGDRYQTNWTSEPKYTTQSPLQFTTMGVGDVWKNYQGFESGDKPITVAIIDSGIDIYHEDFLKPEAKNVNITSSNVTDYSILDPKSCYIYDTSNGKYSSSVKTEVGILKAYDTDTYDSVDEEYYSHGTASAACVGAAINGVGGLGIAPKCNLLIIRMDFYFTSLDKAIRYAADNGADVINMSLGAYAETFTDGYGKTQNGSSSTASALTSAINYALGKDCVVVAAAGNEKTNHKSYPACNAGVIGVGALDSKSKTTAAGFSNYNLDSDTSSSNNNVDVMAPGYVYTANMDADNGPKTGTNLKDSSYQNTQGTSFASPLTAGTVALARSKFPNLSHTEIENLLTSTCADIGNTGWDKKFGYGRVDVSALLGNTYNVEELSISNSSLELYNNGKTGKLMADVIPDAATNKLIHWTSSNPSVATVPSTSNAGAEIEVTPLSVGSTTITAKSDFDQTIKATCSVTVKQYVSSEFSYTISKTSLIEGETAQITTTFTNSSPTEDWILYDSSDTKVATVDDNGLVTAVGVGSTTISIMTEDDLQEFTITVSADPTKRQGTITFSDWSTGGSSTTPIKLTAINGALSASVTKGYNNGSQIREYAGGSVTISVDNGVINSFTISCSDSNNGGTITVTSGGGSAQSFNNSGKYGVSYTAGATPSSSVTFSNGSQMRFTTIDVTYKLNGTPVVTNYTVSFNSNGGSGTMDNATTNGSSYVVPECSYTYEGYTFSKWALGSATGTQYAVGETISDISGNITLYALWTKNQSTGGGDSEDTTSKIYTFTDKNWSPWTSVKAGNGFSNSGVQITSGATGANANSTTSFNNVKKVIVTYCTNSSKGAGTVTVKIGSSTLGSFDVTTTGGTTARTAEIIATNALSGIANISVNCTENSIYVCGIEIFEGSSEGDTPVTQNYTVSFNKNGGTGTMANATTNGSSYTVPACEFTYTGYTFDKWALNSASGAKYAVGDTITGISANITLYATWTENSTPTPDYGTYYKSITATSGTLLLGQLHDLSVTNHTNYNSYSDISTTNCFKTDPYGTGNSYIRDFYSGGKMNNTIVSSGSNGWNREHLWCQSLSNDLWGQSGGGADLQHLRPTVATINSDRGSKKYATITGSKTESTYVDPDGKTMTGGYYTSTLFEPIDSKKGDVARILMYTYMHYNKAENISGTKDGSTSSYFGTLNFTNVVSAANEAAAKQLLLTWNESDPVDSIEITRNTEAAKITGCRNPFIDHPEYADAIWGTAPVAKTLSSITLSGSYQTAFTVGDTFSYTGLVVTANYSDETHANVTPTSVSSPDMSTAGTKTVTVTYTEGETTKTATYDITVSAKTTDVTSITLSQDKAQINVGETLTLVATVLPDNATDKSVTWSTSDNSVATVANGVVTGVSAGTATITAKTSNNKTATCSVTVKAQQSGGSSGNYVKVTSALTDWSGEYLIVNETAGVAFNGSLTKLDAVNNNFSVTISNDTIVSTETTEANNFTISKTDDNYWAIQSKSGYYIGGASSNGLSSGTSITTELKNTISFSNGVFTIKGSKGSGSKTLGYNSAQDQNRFRYMGNTSIQLYKKEAGSTPNPDTPQVTNIELDKPTLSLDKYDSPTSGTLTATVTADEGADTSITWESKDTSVATVTGSGSTATVNAIGEGTTKIIAKAGNETAECTVTVTANAEYDVVSLELVPTTSSVPYLSGTDGKTTVEATLTATFREGGSKVVTPDSSNFVVDTTVLGNKTISASYGGKSATALVKVTNSGANIPTGGSGGTTSFTIGNTGVSDTSYTDFSYEDTTTGAKFGGKVSNNGGIQIRSKDSNTGIIQTASAGKVTKITISYTTIGNGFQIYGKNSAYKAASDLFNTSTQGTLIATVTSSGVAYANANQASTMDAANPEAVTTKEVTITGDFDYVGIRSINGAVVLSEIDYEFGGSASSGPSDGEKAQAKAWAQYMIEMTRTENACLANTDEQKLAGLKDVWSDLASEYSAMTSGAKDEFCTSTDLKIVEAREHYKYIVSKFGALNLGSDGAFVTNGSGVSLSTKTNNVMPLFNMSNQTSIIIVISFIGITSIGLYFFIKKRKEIE